MNFTRNNTVATSLDIGLFNKIPSMMGDSKYKFDDYISVLLWALEDADDISVFKYVVGMNDKSWYGKKIDIKLHINDLLWEAVIANKIKFVECLLEIAGLFDDICLNLEETHIHIKVPINENSRTDREILFSIGLYFQKAMQDNSFEIADIIKNYCIKEKELIKNQNNFLL